MTQNKGKILVVDDLPNNLRLLETLLTKRGYEVRLAPNGNLALISLEHFLPDLILLDIKMPNMDGYEVCSKLKANNKTQDIPVIFLTALDDITDKEKAFSSGAADFITKPFQDQEIFLRINHHLTLQYQKQQLIKEIQKRQEIEANLKLQYERQKAINRIIKLIRDSLDLSTILANSVTELGEFLSANQVLIFQYFPPNIWQSITQYNHPDPIIFTNSYQTIQQIFHNSTLVNLAQTDLISSFKTITQPDNCLLCSIIIDQQIWGILLLIPPNNDQWKESDQELTLAVIDQIAIAIKQSQLYKQLQLLASLDGLTKIANRHHFDQILNQQWTIHYNHHEPLSLILLDIDSFKNYNDYYGHLLGDQCLKKIAQTINQLVLSPNQLVARYGGEEFAIILPSTNQDQALQQANQILVEIQKLQIPHARSEISQIITLSIGVATIIPIELNSETILIQQADLALYRAKHQGRNQICLYPS